MASIFESLLDRIGSLPAALRQLFLRSPATSPPSSSCSQLVEDLEKLCRKMKRIRALLNDAEEREIREESVKLWLDELRDVAYDAEDVFGDVEYELLQYRLSFEGGHLQAPTTQKERGISKKRKVSDSLVTPATSPLFDVSFQQQIITSIKKINGRLEEIYEDRCNLGLREEDGQRYNSGLSEQATRAPTSCFVDEQSVRGRDDDKRMVIDMLLSDDDSDCNKNVHGVSIVGLGGLGKTTLAQLVFNDTVVANHFEKRLWVCVSDTFEVTRLTTEILEQILGRSSELRGFDSLQRSLRSELQAKRFLLALDDVWNEDPRPWEALWISLLSGAKGSRVLITTRNVNVSRTSGVSEANMYQLSCLSDEDSWSLFKQRAFSGKSSDDYPELVPIGWKIVRKCKGLPLAVKTMASLLFCEFNKDKWEDILRSELWELTEGKDKILPSLKLSYHHLPSHIKPCFAYCAIFGKGHVFDKERLVEMWMAQDYITTTARQCKEDVGRRYFEDLLQRSFFQKSRYFDSFVMHDLIHDLAMFICSGDCCEVVDGKLSSTSRVRHLLCRNERDFRRLLSCGCTDDLLKSSRTCYCVGDSMEPDDVDGAFFMKAMEGMFMKMKYLRVLHFLCIPEITELPDSLGNLKHLRYLHIYASGLTTLPESVGNLLNLQTLRVETPELNGLPQRLKDLVHLRHLCITGDFLGLTDSMGNLHNLRTLEVQSDNLNDLPESLGNLLNLQTLEVKARRLKDLPESLGNLFNLRTLEVQSDNLNDLPESLGNLLNLQTLEVKARRLKDLPESLGNLLNLRTLEVQSDNLNDLPESLGNLLNLQTLNIVAYSEGKPWRTSMCSDLHLLSVMPSGIRRLTQLRSLPLFVVGEGSGTAGVEELTYLNNLQGNLEICVHSLKNLVGGNDNYEKGACILKNKVGLESLTLRFPSLEDWSKDESAAAAAAAAGRVDGESAGRQENESAAARRSENESVAASGRVDGESAGRPVNESSAAARTDNESARLQDVKSTGLMNQGREEELVESLQAPTSITKLEIIGYGGRRFPNWMGDPCYARLERIHLRDCKKCRLHLPALGQLPELKILQVHSAGALESVGRDFLEATSFLSLEELELTEIEECVEELWIGTEGGGAFPRLRRLLIIKCGNLKYVKLRQLTALREITILDCEELRMLDYYGDDVSVSHSSSSPPPLSSLHQQEVLVNVGHTHIPGVEDMHLYRCPELNFLPGQPLPPSLQTFHAGGSPLLEEWIRSHDDKLVGVPWLPFRNVYDRILSLRNVKDRVLLREVDGENCQRKMELRWDEEQRGFSSSSPAEAEQLLGNRRLYYGLYELVIRGYRGRSFPDWLVFPECLPLLFEITLSGCVHCDRLPPLGRLPSLLQLHISGMPQIRHVGPEFCVGPGAFPCLWLLEFDDMPEWEEWQGIEEGAFPALQVLRIRNCPNLITLQLTAPLQLGPMRGPPCFGSLSELHISGISSLKSVSFPFWAAQDLCSSLSPPGSSISILWETTGGSHPTSPVIQVE